MAQLWHQFGIYIIIVLGIVIILWNAVMIYKEKRLKKYTGTYFEVELQPDQRLDFKTHVACTATTKGNEPFEITRSFDPPIVSQKVFQETLDDQPFTADIASINPDGLADFVDSWTTNTPVMITLNCSGSDIEAYVCLKDKPLIFLTPEHLET